jgi:hypothetical protein
MYVETTTTGKERALADNARRSMGGKERLLRGENAKKIIKYARKIISASLGSMLNKKTRNGAHLERVLD